MTATAAVAVADVFDAHGNYAEHGDLHVQGESLDSLVFRITAHLHVAFPAYRFSVSKETYAGGRTVHVNIVDGPAGLSDEATRTAFEELVKQEVKRFDWAQGNVYQDYHSGYFFSRVQVDPRYYATHALIEPETEVERRMTLAAFKRTVKVGDRLALIATNNEYSKRLLGKEREIIQVRSGDFIVMTDGKHSYFSYPKANAFACDGERIRVSDANANSPDSYRLYRWIRT